MDIDDLSHDLCKYQPAQVPSEGYSYLCCWCGVVAIVAVYLKMRIEPFFAAVVSIFRIPLDGVPCQKHAYVNRKPYARRLDRHSSTPLALYQPYLHYANK